MTLRILQVVLSLGAGGTERLVIEISKALHPQSRLQVCCLDEEGRWARELTDLGIPVTALGRRPGFRPSLALQIAKLARQQRAQVLHCHHFSPFIYGTLASLVPPRVKVVYTEHGRLSDAPSSPKRKLATRWFSRTCDAIFAVSDDLRQRMILDGIHPARVGVIYNGIDPGSPPTSGDRSAARSAMGLRDGDLAIGTVARFDRLKDLPTLLSAFASLPQSRAPIALVLIGDGPDRPRLEALASELGVSDRIRFTGHRDDVRSLLPALDAYVNSSLTEGLSISILEAMAASLPVVATRVGGTPELVLENETGLLTPARDSPALAATLADVLASPERLRTLGRAGRQRVKTHFTHEGMVERYLKAYKQP